MGNHKGLPEENKEKVKEKLIVKNILNLKKNINLDS